MFCVVLKIPEIFSLVPFRFTQFRFIYIFDKLAFSVYTQLRLFQINDGQLKQLRTYRMMNCHSYDVQHTWPTELRLRLRLFGSHFLCEHLVLLLADSVDVRTAQTIKITKADS